MLKNTESRTWQGVWYLPQSDVRHYGILKYEPESGISLELLSKGFGIPGEVDISEGENSERVSAVESIPQPNDVKNYPVVFGEAEGKKITLFGLTKKSSKKLWGGQVEHALAEYQSASMVRGAHIADRDDKIFATIEVAVDHLHKWLPGTGPLEVTSSYSRSGLIEHIAQAKINENTACLPEVELSSGLSLGFFYTGSLPILKHSAYEYSAGVSATVVAEFKGKEEFLSIGLVAPEISALEALVSIFLDVRCHAFAYRGLVKTDESKQYIDILIPRCGVVPTTEVTGRRGEGLVRCQNEEEMIRFIGHWFSFFNENFPALSFLVGFLADPGNQILEPTILMAGSLVEAFHKRMFGEKNKDLLPGTAEVIRSTGQNIDLAENKRTYLFVRVIDLCQRVPEKIRAKLIPNQEKLASVLKNSRNDLSHDAKLDRSGVLESYAAAKLVIAVVTVLVLLELGVEERRILYILEETNSISSAKNLARRYLK